MRKFLVLLCLATSSFVFSQVEEPKITPTSPEAAAMERYGDLDVMSSTGQMTYSVPIHTIAVNGYSWPVTLNYSYNGLILEGKPSLNGLGWNLSAYGAISKEVRGLPDGHPYGYYGIHNVKAEIEAAAADYGANATFNTTDIYKIRKFSSGEWDTEVDKYTVNVGGINFSFKLRKDSNGDVVPYFLSQHNYKLDITMDQFEHFVVASFIITDDNGIKYYFDADNREHAVTADTNTSSLLEDKYTSWLLSKIVYPNNQEIEFQYQTDTYFSWDFVASALSLYADPEEEGISGAGEFQYQTFDSDKMNRTELSRQLLSKIVFPTGTIDFTTITKDNSTGTTTDDRKVFSKIELKDYHNNIIDSYDFTYTGNRDLLIEIQKNSEFFYGFEYYGLTSSNDNVPTFCDDYSKKPYAQDLWRFYNGKIGNNSAFSLGSASYTADRTPSVLHARLGALMNIHYKTGGKSKVIYEQNQIKKPYNGATGGNNLPFNKEFIVELNPTASNNEREIIQQITFTQPTYANISHIIDGQLWSNYFQMSITRLDTEACSVPYQCYNAGPPPSTLTSYAEQASYWRSHMIEGIGGATCDYFPHPIMCPSFISTPTGPDDTTTATYYEADSTRGNIYISPGTYEIKITTNPNEWTEEPQYLFNVGEMYGKIHIKYHDPSVGGVDPAFVNTNIGGIRVASILDYDEHGNQVSTRSYDYNDATGFSTGTANQVPVFSDVHRWYYTNSPNPPHHWTKAKEEHRQAAFTNLNATHGVPVYYSKITVTNSSGNLVNSRAEQTYHPPMEGGGYYSYPRFPKHSDLTKSLPKTNKQFKVGYLINDYPVETTTNTYDAVRYTLDYNTGQDPNPDHPISFKAFKRLVLDINFAACSGCYMAEQPDIGTDQELALRGNYALQLYKEVEARREIKQTDVSREDYQMSTNYYYDSMRLLQSTTTTDSKGDLLITELDYPYEVSETQYQSMISYNQVSTPVQQRTIKNSTLLSSQKTNFIQVQNGYKPVSIYAAKGTATLENKLQYTYDNLGNITSYVKEDGSGTSTVIIWGYKKQYPIAKIVNATYNQIAALVPNLQSLSNADNDTSTDYTGTEGALRQALDDLRSNGILLNTQITTYTYNPFIGITSVTDPRGNTIYYEYDNQHRLKHVRDKDGNLLSKNEYNYRPLN